MNSSALRPAAPAFRTTRGPENGCWPDTRRVMSASRLQAYAAAFGLPSFLFFAGSMMATPQFKEIGPAPISATVARQQMRALLEKVDTGNRQLTIQTLSGLTPWYRDLLDEELIAAWRSDDRAKLTQVIGPLADPRVAAGIVEFSWRQQRQATFTPDYAPMLGDLMARYPDSATMFLDDLFRSTAMGQAPDLSQPEAEAVCRILLDMPDIRTWKKSALQILPHYRREVQVLLDNDLHGDDRERMFRATRWLADLGAANSASDAQRGAAAPTPSGSNQAAHAGANSPVSPGRSSSAAHGVTLTPLDPTEVDDSSRSLNSNSTALMDLVNRSRGKVDIYWIDFQGKRVPQPQCMGLPVGATCTERTFLTHPFLVVVSGTGGTTARDTGTRIAGFQAVTPNGTLDPAKRDIAIISSPGAPLATPRPQSTPPEPARTARAAEVSAPSVDMGQVRTMVNKTDGQRYVWIPPGSFTMGCSPGDTECAGDEKPPREERIAHGFWLGQTEVTQAAYLRTTGGNPSAHKGDQLPVESLAWSQAANYCKAIDARLPTEVEWEYAARAGSTWARYGNLDDVAWHSGNSGGATHPVATKQPNAFGLYDMLGNVWEYVADGYPGSSDRILRGGSLLVDIRNTRASSRMRRAPSDSANGRGFRCAGDGPGAETSASSAVSVPNRPASPPTRGQREPMVNKQDGQRYVWIPPGAFTMGCSAGDSECNDNEKPPHAEQIANGFWLGETEVTQEAYRRVTGGNPSHTKGEQLPVDSVTWNDANRYCGVIGGHLPTETEWEYAARGHAGSTTARYGDLDAVAWHSGNSGGTTHLVAQKQLNAFGLYDMLGNVWEWVEDTYAGDSIQRGGSSVFSPQNARASRRSVVAPSASTPSTGFRCAGEWPVPEQTPPGGSAATPLQATGSGGGPVNGVYRIGNGVSAPALLRKVEPQYSEEARQKKYQGSVLLYIQIDPSGKAINVRVLHSLGLGLDEKAMEAVKKWIFRPGYKDGKPVTVESQVEINFRLL